MNYEKPIVCLELNSFEQRLAVNGLTNFRNYLIAQGQPVEDVEELLLKIIDAPPKRMRGFMLREAR